MELGNTRGFSEFCEQLNEMRLRFHRWDSCERTIALYYLMVGLPYANARFLHYALEQCIETCATPDTKLLDRNANDVNFISSVLSEKPQIAMNILLVHLPLLKPGNKEAAECYLSTIRKVLADFITPPFKIYNECVEIMSYIFVHPAFEKEDKKSFKQLLKQIVTKVSPENFVHSNESSDESISPNPEPTNFNLNRRSNSLTPAQTEPFTKQSESWSSQENLAHQPQKPRSYSLSCDKTINIPSAGLQLSSSETRLQDLQSSQNKPIQKSIVSWLKSLRLHKYSWVFHQLSYDQMMELTEPGLSHMGITKGARHKLLLSIGKLRERSAMLRELEGEVMNGGDLLAALKKLKGVLQSPLLVNNGEDLSAQFVKVMGKVCTQLLMLRQPVDECLVLFSTLCEKGEGSEAFTTEQKRRLALWRGQIGKATHSSYNHGYSGNSRQKQQSYTFQPGSSGSAGGKSSTYTNKSSSYPNVQLNQVVGGHRHSIGSITVPKAAPLQGILQKDQSSSEGGYVFHTVGPNHVRFLPDSESDRASRKKNVDIESSLESLCLQMMEHALGP